MRILAPIFIIIALAVFLPVNRIVAKEKIASGDSVPPEKDESGFTLIPLPWLIASSDLGVGPVGLLLLTESRPGTEPFKRQITLVGARTNLGFEVLFLKIDTRRILDTPFRLVLNGGFIRDLETNYFGRGNYQDIRRQQRIRKGEIPVQKNIPSSPDLLQGEEVSLNADFPQNPEAGLNPGRRILRESQNKYFFYVTVLRYLYLNLENRFGDTNFKWNVGAYYNRYQIYSYEGEKENNNTVPNTKTLLDLDRPTGYDAVGDVKYANIVAASLLYDSRPPGREVSPSTGTYTGFNLEGAGRESGSDYSFRRVTIFFTHYFSLFPDFFHRREEELVFALRAQGMETYGNVPFFEEKGLGGKLLRGYPANQFVDRVAVLGGAELRYNFIRSSVFGGTDYMMLLFLDQGRVAPERRQLTLREWHRSAGLGFDMLVKKNTMLEFVIGFSRYEKYFELTTEHTFNL